MGRAALDGEGPGGGLEFLRPKIRFKGDARGFGP